MLMRAAAKERNWNLNYGGIALMCAAVASSAHASSARSRKLTTTIRSSQTCYWMIISRGEIKKSQKGWRNIVATAAKKGIPVPAFSTALAFYDQYRSAVLPANLLQAQRDYFGAHTYERVDKPRGEFFHTNWTGKGGTTSSSTYNV